MADRDANKDDWRDEPFAAAAGVLSAFLMAMLVGIAVIVGTAHMDPRAAALFMLGPAVLFAAVCATFKPLRRLFFPWRGRRPRQRPTPGAGG